ncbi:uncharacterized protein LOC143919062 isoform X2 [Arctopsyche grandis]|uniref:uncharacterized protein LOC143919062 isoform X2 n=1 Tax=Arctopsyche grandis TaxID=121162 RepID=UPI00406D9614
MMKCRLCLSPLSAESSVSIFDSPERHLLKQQIWFCCQLHVEKDDRLPNMMCILCKYKLESFTTFRNVCIQSDESLKSTEILNIKSEEVILDDLIVKDECDNNSLIDTFESAVNYDFDGCELNAFEICDSEKNVGLIEIENTSQITQMQEENISLSSIEISSITDNEKQYQCNESPKIFNTKKKLGCDMKSQILISQLQTVTSTEGLEFFTNQCGYISLKYLGFQYNKYREVDVTGVIIWRCKRNRAMRCNATIRTNGNSIVKEPSEHNDSCSYKNKNKSAPDLNQYQCNECLRIFNTKIGISIHMGSHMKMKSLLQPLPSTPGMAFFTNRRGNDALVYLGFQYNKAKSFMTDVTTWRCVKLRSFCCNSTMKLYGNSIVKEPSEHNHAPCLYTYKNKTAPDSNQYQCNECLKIFNTKTAIRLHMDCHMKMKSLLHPLPRTSGMEFFTNQRGNDALLYLGFKYNKASSNVTGVTTWRCSELKTFRCNSSMKLSGNFIFKEPSEHNHDFYSYKNKKKTAKDSNQYQCNECLRMFKSKIGITIHIKCHVLKSQLQTVTRSTEGLNFFTNHKGYISLIYLSFQYNKYKESELTGTLTWRCKRNKAMHCSALIHTYGNSVVKGPTEHNGSCSYKNNKTASDLNQYQCNECLKIFNTKTAIRLHMDFHMKMKSLLHPLPSTTGMEFFTNQRGNDALLYLGFKYNKASSNVTDVTTWRCVKLSTFRCKSSMKLYGNFIFKEPSEHNHASYSYKNKKKTAQDSNQYQCNECLRIFNTKIGISIHMGSHMKMKSLLQPLPSTPGMEFFTNRRGNDALVYLGFQYNKAKSFMTDVTTWRCVKLRSFCCNSSMKLYGNSIVKEPSEHNHAPCSYTYKNKTAPDSNQYQCNECLKIFNTKTAIRLHMDCHMKMKSLLHPLPSTSGMEFFTNQRGNDALLYLGFKYNKASSNVTGVTTWRCSKLKTFRCNSSMKLYGNFIFKEPSEHNHAFYSYKNKNKTAPDSNQYQCNECLKIFNTKTAIRLHMDCHMKMKSLLHPLSSTSGVEFFTNQRGNDALLYLGFKYNKASSNVTGVTTWRCSKLRTFRCNSSMKLYGNFIFKEPSEHNHAFYSYKNKKKTAKDSNQYQCNECLRMFKSKIGITIHIKCHVLKSQLQTVTRSTEGLNFFTNHKGYISLIYLSFQYNKYKESELTGTLTWRCKRNKAMHCSALIHTYGNSVVKGPTEHNGSCSYKNNKTASDLNQYQCNECLKIFNTKTAIRLHMDFHMKMKSLLHPLPSTTGMEFFTNQRGNDALLYLGFKYNKASSNVTDVTTWRCVKLSTFRCKSSMKLYGNFIFKEPSEHNHASYSYKNKKKTAQDSNQYQCNECLRMFKSKIGITIHMKSHVLKSQLQTVTRSTEGLNFFTNHRGYISLTYLGFQYNNHREVEVTGVKTWRCKRNRAMHCSALIHTYGNSVVKGPSEHNSSCSYTNKNKTASDSNQYQCNECLKIFNTKTAIRLHMDCHMKMKSLLHPLPSTTDMEFFTTQRGNDAVLYLGFHYNKASSNVTDVTTWRCVQLKVSRCNSTLKLYGNCIIREPSPHNHDPCPQKVKANIALNKILQSIKQDENVTQAIENAMIGLNDDIVAYFPKRDSIVRRLWNIKHRQTSKSSPVEIQASAKAEKLIFDLKGDPI